MKQDTNPTMSSSAGEAGKAQNSTTTSNQTVDKAPAAPKDKAPKQEGGKKDEKAAADSEAKKISGAELKKQKQAEKAARREKEKAERAAALGQTGSSQQAPPKGAKGGDAKKGAEPAQKGAAAQGQQPQHKKGMSQGGNLPLRGKSGPGGAAPPTQQQQNQQRKLKEVGLFGHLYTAVKRNTMEGVSKEVHPAVLALGLQMSTFTVCGSNARCVAMLLAFKKVSCAPCPLPSFAPRLTATGHSRLPDSPQHIPGSPPDLALPLSPDRLPQIPPSHLCLHGQCHPLAQRSHHPH